VLKGESAVLVIGAGPAGAAAANVLARAGVDVALIDRARFPRDKTCGDAVSNNGLRLLQELGALDAIKREPYAEVRRGIARFPDGSSIAREYEDPGFIVARLTLDDAIRRAAVAAGARMAEGASARELVVENGRVCGVRGDALDWRAKLVIAADGYGSIAWSHVGANPKQGRGLAVSTTGYYRDVRFPDGATNADHYFEADLPCGYGWIFPEVSGVANAGVYLRRDAYQKQGRSLADLMSAFVARHPERFAGAERVGALRTWSLPIAPARFPASAPGLLIAGDAGGFIDPLSGEGIWQALHTGKLAGAIAAEAIGQGELTPHLRGRFEAECERAIRRPSRAKLAVQDALRVFVGAKLYRVGPLRAALRLAYAARAFEMTKA
jgi:geranylgeranyl reductase family protein